jgi:hypothetical protein
MVELYLHSPISLYGIVLSQLSTGTTLLSIQTFYPVSTCGFFLGGQAAGLETDRSPPSCAEVKNAWNDASISPHVFLALYVFKHRHNFTVTMGLVYEETKW